MNFLEAHKIFHEYSELLAKGNYSKQALPCNGDFEQMNNAAIIVISHDYYFHRKLQVQVGHPAVEKLVPS